MRILGFDLKYSEEDIRWMMDEFEKVLQAGFISMGSHAREFEEKFAGSLMHLGLQMAHVHWR
jgi:dTDP-4-amino-4,6-dideoxygalactose transaminase